MCLLFAVATLLICIALSVMASGRIESCYVKYNGSDRLGRTEYAVKGDVNWREDVVLGYADSAEAAQLLLEKICPTK